MNPLAYIIGTGQTQFGELFDYSLEDLIREAGIKALKDAGLNSFDQLDLIVAASMTMADLQHQNHLSSLVTQVLGTTCPVISVDAACASSSAALGVALQYLNLEKQNLETSKLSPKGTGNFETALVLGVEKLTDHSIHDVTTSLAGAASYAQEGRYGITFPALGALVAQRYFHEYPKVPKGILADIAIKNHSNGMHNPIAHFRRPLDEKTYSEAPYVAEPLKLYDSAPISDGATAIIISNKNFETSKLEYLSNTTNNIPSRQHEATQQSKRGEVPAGSRNFETKSSAILAFSQTHDAISLHHRSTITSFAATKRGIKNILRQANIKLADINVMELHDAFTILEMIALEDLGFYEPGQAYRAIQNGQTQITGQHPVNPSGGQKSCGHPVAATGLRQIIEIHNQVLGQADKRQVTDARLGLTQNFGGLGGTCIMTLIAKP